MGNFEVADMTLLPQTEQRWGKKSLQKQIGIRRLEKSRHEGMMLTS